MCFDREEQSIDLITLTRNQALNTLNSIRIISLLQATWILMSPLMINRLLKSGAANDYDLSSVRRVIHTGSSLSIQSYNAFAKFLPNAEILSGYGMTESGIHLSLQTKTSKPGSCGQLLANTLLKVVDPITRQTLGVNQRGELLLKSAFMMNCYYNNPHATAKAFDDEGMQCCVFKKDFRCQGRCIACGHINCI